MIAHMDWQQCWPVSPCSLGVIVASIGNRGAGRRVLQRVVIATGCSASDTSISGCGSKLREGVGSWQPPIRELSCVLHSRSVSVEHSSFRTVTSLPSSCGGRVSAFRHRGRWACRASSANIPNRHLRSLSRLRRSFVPPQSTNSRVSSRPNRVIRMIVDKMILGGRLNDVSRRLEFGAGYGIKQRRL